MVELDLNLLGQRGAHTLKVHFLGVKSTRLDKELMAWLVRESDDLCLNGGIKLREGFYRRVENNIMVNNTLHAHAWFEDSRDVFTHNIVMTPYQPYQPQSKGNELDFNIFTDSLAFNKAREMGKDARSIVAHAEFENPGKGLFIIRDDSDAIRTGGFMNIPMDSFGVVSPRLKRVAAIPVLTSGETPEYAGGDEIWYWKKGNNKE